MKKSTTKRTKVSKNSQTNDKISALMTKSLIALRELVDNDEAFEIEYFQVVSVFLQGVISTAVDLAELHSPGASPFIYADIESLAKSGGLYNIKKMQDETSSVSHSVSNISQDDMSSAMNYLGQQMSTTLFKGIHELPMPLRKEETLLRAVEALLTNLLQEKFDNPHVVLNSFCDHVHMSLDDLATRINKKVH